MNLVIIAVCAILNRLGGSKNKGFRRIGIGIALAVYGLWIGNWLALLCVGTSQLFRLPITFKGDSIPEHWFNWPWLYVCGFLYGLVPFPLSIPAWTHGLVSAGVFGLIFGTIVTLSNVKATAEIFKWQRVELAYGAVLGVAACLLNKLRKKS